MFGTVVFKILLSTKKDYRFLCVALCLAQVILLLEFGRAHDPDVYTNQQVSTRINSIFVAVFAVSAPLIFDSIVDLFLCRRYANYQKALGVHYFADFLINISIFASGVTILISSRFSVQFLLAIVCYGQSLAVIGLLGRLFVLDCRIGTELLYGVFCFFVVSQVLLVRQYDVCRYLESCSSQVYLPVAVGCNFACLVLLALSLQSYVIRPLKILHSNSDTVAPPSMKRSLTEKYAIGLNCSILSGLLLLHLLSLCLAWGDGLSRADIVFYNLIVHLVAVILAVALPKHIHRLENMKLVVSTSQCFYVSNYYYFVYVRTHINRRKLPARKPLYDTFLTKFGMYSVLRTLFNLLYFLVFSNLLSLLCRSPLSTTTLGLDFLLAQMAEHLISYEEAMDVISDAKVSADLATSTMNDLLLFDKITTQKLQVFPEKVRAWKFVAGCVRPFKTQMHLSQISLFCTVEDAVTTHATYCIQIDKPKMEQVIRNFLTNAIKFTPRGGNVTVTAQNLANYSNGNPDKKEVGTSGVFRISFKDSGPGIAPVSIWFDAIMLYYSIGYAVTHLLLLFNFIFVTGKYVETLWPVCPVRCQYSSRRQRFWFRLMV
jgi:signal transduction histidine kinase